MSIIPAWVTPPDPAVASCGNILSPKAPSQWWPSWLQHTIPKHCAPDYPFLSYIGLYSPSKFKKPLLTTAFWTFVHHFILTEYMDWRYLCFPILLCQTYWLHTRGKANRAGNLGHHFSHVTCCLQLFHISTRKWPLCAYLTLRWKIKKFQNSWIAPSCLLNEKV